jgi:hypothetical protein
MPLNAAFCCPSDLTPVYLEPSPSFTLPENAIYTFCLQGGIASPWADLAFLGRHRLKGGDLLLDFAALAFRTHHFLLLVL